MSIKVSNVTKYFDKQKVLDSISFSIPHGKIVGFIGPNGAGKTTTMRILTGYLYPDQGEVFINGIKLEQDVKSIRRQIGYLPENNPLYYDMYVEDFLMFIAGLYKLDNKRQKVNNVIELTGLLPEKTKKISQLSKGFKQRVGLAQAIIHDPNVLILDEPTSGLDPNQIVEIRNLIKTLGQEKTVLLSTHIMQEVEAICDHVIIINKGKIVADASPESIHTKVKEDMKKYLIEFDSDVKRADLERIKGVEEVHYLKSRKWLIISIDDVRKEIFDFAVENRISVLTMEQKRKSLEEIFQELTKNPN